MLEIETLELSGGWSTRVRHQNIDATELLIACVDETCDVIRIRNIGGGSKDAGASCFFDLVRDAFDRFLFARANDQRRAFCRKFFGNGPAQSATGGGDESDFVFETQVHLIEAMKSVPPASAGGLRIQLE